VLVLTLSVQTESVAQNVLDGAYIKEHVPTRRVIPYPHLREADVMYSKRIWRTLDLREKINHPIYYPEEEIDNRLSLFNVIKNSLLKDGSITAYDPGIELDDEFKVPFGSAELKSLFFKKDTQWVEDPDTGEYMEIYQDIELESTSVKKYWMKEDWFFDRQRSVMDVRIIGLAPMVENVGEDGEIRGETPIFWLYFPECRYVFANAEVFNRQNDAERRTFEDIFWKRMFSSYIHKVSNVYDRYISQHKKSIDALLESDRIKDELFKIEHDLWSF